MKIKLLIHGAKNAIVNKWIIAVGCFLILFIVFSNIFIIQTTKNHIYTTYSDVPKKDVLLLLGTSKYTSNGYANLFFNYRINAAADLYHLGKIKHIIVSGDNSLIAYNEPRQMLKALLKLGVPAEAVTLDFAGFRTLDSVVRCKEVFGQNDIVIISQRFHLERALFIANKYHINAVGFAARNPPDNYVLKTQLREYFAKTLAVIDLYLIDTKPKFLGKKEIIIF